MIAGHYPYAEVLTTRSHTTALENSAFFHIDWNPIPPNPTPIWHIGYIHPKWYMFSGARVPTQEPHAADSPASLTWPSCWCQLLPKCGVFLLQWACWQCFQFTKHTFLHNKHPLLIPIICSLENKTKIMRASWFFLWGSSRLPLISIKRTRKWNWSVQQYRMIFPGLELFSNNRNHPPAMQMFSVIFDINWYL